MKIREFKDSSVITIITIVAFWYYWNNRKKTWYNIVKKRVQKG